MAMTCATYSSDQVLLFISCPSGIWLEAMGALKAIDHLVDVLGFRSLEDVVIGIDNVFVQRRRLRARAVTFINGDIADVFAVERVPLPTINWLLSRWEGFDDAVLLSHGCGCPVLYPRDRWKGG